MPPCWSNQNFSGGWSNPPWLRFQQILNEIRSENRDSQLAATVRLRELLSEPDPPIDDVAQPDVVTRLVQFLSNDDFPQLKYEAAWVLANVIESENAQSLLIDSGAVPLFVQLSDSDREEDRSLALRVLAYMAEVEDTQVLVENGAVSLFVQHLNSDNEEDRFRAVRALGNIAIESVQRRDHVLDCQALMPLLAQFGPYSTQYIVHASLTLYCLLDWSPLPPPDQIRPIIPVVTRLLSSQNSDVLSFSAAILASFFVESDDDMREWLMDSGAVPLLVELLSHEMETIQYQVFRTINDVFLNGTEDHFQVVIESQPLRGLSSFWTKTNRAEVKRAIFRIVRRITSLDERQAEKVIQSGIIKHMIQFLPESNSRSQMHIVQAISNLTLGENTDHIKLLVSQGCIEALCSLLTCTKESILSAALDSLGDILHSIEKGRENLYARTIRNLGGLENIKLLVHHEDEDIRSKVTNILVPYF